MIKTFLTVLFLSLALAFGLVTYRVYTFFTSVSVNRDVVLVIPEGTSFRQIAQMLKDNGVVKDPYLFEFLARVKGVENRVRAGRYQFSPALHPDAVLSSLIKGQLPELSLVVPEGWTMAQVAMLVSTKTGEDASMLLALMKNPDWLRTKVIASATAEGYLFPDTYAYDASTTGEALLTQMVDTFHRRIDPLWKAAKTSPLPSFQEVITLASIVEKEARVDAERPLIARVYLNRLRLGMPLQADPTVIYGIQGFNGNLTRKDLETDQPYNTYKRAGLTPTPIANPGLASIQAVLAPAEGDYLYFVAKPDGTHQFSQTLEEHNRAVETYQILPARSLQQEAASEAAQEAPPAPEPAVPEAE